jgi:hypothetical protein
MSSNRISRLARRLFGSDREGVHFDKEKKESYPHRLRIKGLSKYKGRKDVFGSFTEIGTKLGINPRSPDSAIGDSTPFGIYAYPIDVILGYWHQGFQGFGSEEGWVYGTGKPFLHIFQVKGFSRALIFTGHDTREIGAWESGHQPIFPYEDKLRDLPGVKGVNEETYIKWKRFVVRRIKCDEAFVWLFTKELSKGNRAKWTGFLRQIGLIGAIDYGTATINEVEPEQAVFFDPASIKELEVVENEFPKQYERPDAKHRQFSEWSDDPVAGSLRALNKALSVVAKVSNLFKSDHNGDKNEEIKNELMELSRIIAWKKTHETTDRWWDKRNDNYLAQLLRAGMSYSKQEDLPPNIKRLINKIYGMLGK